MAVATERRFIERLTPERLRGLLDDKGIDPTELARQLGIHPATVRCWLRAYPVNPMRL